MIQYNVFKCHNGCNYWKKRRKKIPARMWCCSCLCYSYSHSPIFQSCLCGLCPWSSLLCLLLVRIFFLFLKLQISNCRLGYCNSAINPVIYGLFSREFRAAFKRILCKFFCKVKILHSLQWNVDKRLLNRIKRKISSYMAMFKRIMSLITVSIILN